MSLQFYAASEFCQGATSALLNAAIFSAVSAILMCKHQ